MGFCRTFARRHRSEALGFVYFLLYGLVCLHVPRHGQKNVRGVVPQAGYAQCFPGQVNRSGEVLPSLEDAFHLLNDERRQPHAVIPPLLDQGSFRLGGISVALQSPVFEPGATFVAGYRLAVRRQMKIHCPCVNQCRATQS